MQECDYICAPPLMATNKLTDHESDNLQYCMIVRKVRSYQSSSLIAVLNYDVEGRHICAVCACRFVRVGRIWVYDLQSSKVGEEGKKKEDQAIKAKNE
ncbi:hypothetical protein T09_3599, partial [Trichinella sp. T9]